MAGVAAQRPVGAPCDLCAAPVSVPRSRRHEQAATTRDLLVATAERLYAERGVGEVSNRQVAEAAGQANTSAVAYHVGSKTDLVAAVVRSHTDVMAGRMRAMVDAARGATTAREHVECLVRPYTEHLATLGTPGWWARVTAQVATDPTLAEILHADPGLMPAVDEACAAMRELAPPLSDDVAALRDRMTRLMVVHVCAEEERTAARTGVAVDWVRVGDTLVDGVTAIVLGPPLSPE